VWPLLIVPLLLSSWFLTYAVGFLAFGVTFVVMREIVWALVMLVLAALCVFGEIAEGKGR
jgi:hypothetical protein